MFTQSQCFYYNRTYDKNKSFFFLSLALKSVKYILQLFSGYYVGCYLYKFILNKHKMLENV